MRDTKEALLDATARSLARSPRYWFRRQRWAPRALLVMFGALVGLWQLGVIQGIGVGTFPSGLGALHLLKLGMQVMIGVFMVIAVVGAVKDAARLDLDTLAARELARNCELVLRGAFAPGGTIPELQDVPSHWPRPAEMDLATIRMCESIYRDAADSFYASRDMLILQYVDEYVARLQIISDRQRNVLHLGILGTFLGLTFALPSLAQIVSAGPSNDSITALLESLKLAFSTSIVGLAASVCLGIAAGALRRRIDDFGRVLERASADMMTLCRKAINRAHTAKTIDALLEVVRTVAQRLEVQNQRLSAQTNEIGAGLERLKLAASSWNDVLSKFHGLNGHLVASADSVAKVGREAVETHIRVADSLVTGVGSTQRALAESNARAIESMSQAAIAELRKVVAGAAPLTEEFGRAVRAAQKELGETHQAAIASLRGAADGIESRLSGSVEMATKGLLETANVEGRNFDERYKKLTEVEGRINDAIRTMLADVAANVQRLSDATQGELRLLKDGPAHGVLTEPKLRSTLRASNQDLLEEIEKRDAELIKRAQRPGTISKWIGSARSMAGSWLR